MIQKLFITNEHETFSSELKGQLKLLNLDLSIQNDDPLCLGLSADYRVGYFIGAQWLVENDSAIVVEPKITNIDYLSMFMECLKNPRSARFSKDIYGIDFDATPIELKSNHFELTPLLIIHFLSLLKGIVQKGLMRDYVWVNENLQSKVKGKLLINQNIKRNTLKMRADRSVCRYQDYSIDCVENRIFKKTLNSVHNYLVHSEVNHTEILNLYHYVCPMFQNVSDEVSSHDFKSIKTHLVFKEYNEALRISDMILKRFSYSINNSSLETEKFPPFYINMALLFEHYVLTKLDKVYGKNILFQVAGSKRTSLDFLHLSSETIIDTKYKECYCEQRGWKKEDIRQLSGYARDKKILKHLDMDTDSRIPHLDCLIIYPDVVNGFSEILQDELKSTPISEFIQFYKYGITLPLK